MCTRKHFYCGENVQEDRDECVIETKASMILQFIDGLARRLAGRLKKGPRPPVVRLAETAP